MDIYNSKEITSDCKINIFRDFTDLICQNYVPLFAQSYQNDCPISLRLNNRQFKNPDEVIAMILLFKEVADVMIKEKFQNVYVTIDDGMNKVVKQLLKKDYNHFLTISAHTDIQFKNSCDDSLLQLADFCAYCYTRQQYLASTLLKPQSNVNSPDYFKSEIYDCVTSVAKHIYNIKYASGKSYDQIEADGSKIKKAIIK